MSEATADALMVLLKNKDESVQVAVVGAFKNHPELFDKLHEAVGLLQALELPAEARTHTFSKPEHLGPLFLSLRFLSFTGQLNLCFGDNGTRC